MTDKTITPAPAGADAGQSEAIDSLGTSPVDGRPLDPPVGDHPAGSATLHDKVLAVQEGVDKLLERFDEKLLHDEARTNEIKRLNAELDKHKPDARLIIVRPLVDQMVRHLDEIQWFVQRYQGQSDATAEDFLEALEWLHESIEQALGEHDVTAYRPQAGKDSFDGRRHSVVGDPVPTEDPSLSRVVERCVRPGFECDGKVVARAIVRIYRYDEKTRSSGRHSDSGRARERS